MKRSFVRLVSALLLGLGMLIALPVPAQAVTHRDKSMIDVDTPVFIGYDSGLQAYQYRVTGRWRAVCGGKFCWPAFNPGSDPDIGTDDAVRIRFSDSVQFIKLRLRTYDSCGGVHVDTSKSFTSDSYEDAYAGLNDEVYPSWNKTVWNGSVTNDSGTCKESTLPTSTFGAGGSGGSGGVTYWANLPVRSFTYDVWINPLPSQGTCYDRLYVKGGYTHTWSTTDGLAFSAGYPWGFGVGPVVGSDYFTVFQGNDGISDSDLLSPKVCHHANAGFTEAGKPVITLTSTDIFNGNPAVNQHIGFSIANNAVSWDCQLDNGPVQACNGPVSNITIGPLGASGHTFTFRAWNAAGISSYTATWAGGQPAPTITTTYNNIANGSTLATFRQDYSFTNGPLTTWYCTLDGAPYNCGSSAPYSVNIGPVAYSGHTYRICIQNYGGVACTGADWVGGAP